MEDFGVKDSAANLDLRDPGFMNSDYFMSQERMKQHISTVSLENLWSKSYKTETSFLWI